MVKTKNNFNEMKHEYYHLHQRRFRRIYLSTNHSPHDPQNLLLAQTNRPIKTPGRIFFDNPFLPIRLNVAVCRHLIYTACNVSIRPDKQRFWSLNYLFFFYPSIQKYVMGAQNNHLNVTALLSTLNVYFSC